MHGSGVVVIDVVWCEVLILSESNVALWLATGFFVSRGTLSLIVSLLCIEL